MFLGERFSQWFMDLYFKWIYDPLRHGHTAVAMQMLKITGSTVTPNIVTTTGCLFVPLAMRALSERQFAKAALHLMIHEQIDRYDGAVAAAFSLSKISRSADWIDGAFYDAMADKVFGSMALAGLIFLPTLTGNAADTFSPTIVWLMRTKVAIQCSLGMIRLVDWCRPPTGWSPQARGEGKVAIAAEYVATAVAALSRDPAWTWSWTLGDVAINGCECIAAALLVLSINYGLYSCQQKILARFAGSKER